MAHDVLRARYMSLLPGTELISSAPDTVSIKTGHLLRGSIAGFDGLPAQKRNIVVVIIKIVWFSAMTLASFSCKMRSSQGAKAGATAHTSANHQDRER